MASRDRTLEKLLKLRTDNEKEALKLWRDGETRLERFKSQLDQIKYYLGVYQEEFKERGRQGLTAQAVISYQNFVAKLEAVIARQELDLIALKEQVKKLEDNYLEKRKERRIIETLIEKHRLETERKALKAEQKLNDEFATTASYQRGRAKK